MRYADCFIGIVPYFCATEFLKQRFRFISNQPHSVLDRVTSYDLPDVPEPYRPDGSAPLDGPAFQRAWHLVGSPRGRVLGAGQPWGSDLARKLSAAFEVISCMGTTHTRPDFGIRSVTIGHREVAVTEEVVHRTPFCSLVRFKKESRSKAAGPDRGSHVRALRDPAARHLRRRCWPNTTSISPTGTTPATCRCKEGRFDFDDFVDH